MKKIAILFFSAFFAFSQVTFAADAATSGNMVSAKIGVVDMQTIATDSEAAKAAKTQLESKFGKEREQLEKRGKDLQKQAEGLKNPKTSEEKKMSFLKSKQKLDNDTRNFLRKVEQEEVKLRQEMVSLVFSATYEVARAKGYNFVVDVTAGGVLYADQSMDLTKDVLEEVNKLYAKNNSSTPAPEQAPPAEAKPKK